MQRSVEDKPATRVYGSETEYGVRLIDGNRDYKKLIDTKVIGQMSTHIELANLGNGFLENGARFYKDHAHNVEYATPECINLRDLVASEFAGEIIVSDFFAEHLEGQAVPNKRVDEFKPTKEIETGDSCGSHENYGTNLRTDEILESDAKYILGTHLATRYIFTGAGCWRDGELHVGQKPMYLSTLASSNTTQNKPLINTREENHSKILTRLHITSGDANIDPWVIRMKFGTTSLVLRMLEHGVKPSGLKLKNPFEAAQSVAKNPANMLEPLELMNGEKASAVELQTKLAEHAAQLAERVSLPQEEQQIIADWLEVCRSLKADIHQPSSHLHEKIDWYRRKRILDKAKGRNKSGQELSFLDLMFDQLGLELGSFMLENGNGVRDVNQMPGFGYRQRQQSLIDLGLVSRVEELLTTPPQTRASFRGQVIRDLSQKDTGLKLGISWGIFDVESQTIEMDPPYSPEPSFDLEEELEKAHKRSN